MTDAATPIIAGTDAALPRNGRWTMKNPRPAFIASIDRWCELPMPDEP